MKWAEKYGEDKMVVMFGGLHIEMAALNTLGDWLRGSGLAQADIVATPGTADSFLRATNVTSTRIAHQITAAAMHILQHRAHEHHPRPEYVRLDFEGDIRDSDCPLGKLYTASSWSELCASMLM